MNILISFGVYIYHRHLSLGSKTRVCDLGIKEIVKCFWKNTNVFLSEYAKSINKKLCITNLWYILKENDLCFSVKESNKSTIFVSPEKYGFLNYILFNGLNV